VPVISRARGAELGARFERNGIVSTATGYYLSLASELVFAGDAGTTEPKDASRRFGSELSLFWRPTDWLTLNGAAIYSRARFRGVAPGKLGFRVPGEPAEGVEDRYFHPVEPRQVRVPLRVSF
jgi:hypothetical protein